MIHAVRCPSCHNLSRVGAEAVGQMVACPHCGRPFAATPDPTYAAPVPPRRSPVVARYAGPPRGRGPVLGRYVDEHESPGAAGDLAHRPSPLLVGLTLLPLGIPLLWFAGLLSVGRPPVFSFAVPVALALGVGGLSLGVGFARGWSPGTRLRAVLALIMLGYFTGAFLFFLKKEWAEAVRRHVGPEPHNWVPYGPPDGAYQVKFPPGPVVKVDSPLPGWDLDAHRAALDPKGRDALTVVAYVAAHGTPPAAAVGPNVADDDWFAKARAAVCDGSGGAVSAEKPVRYRDYAGVEYTVTLPDGATNRIVRVFRVKDRAFYLAVEGAFVPPDARYVRYFFDTFAIAGR